MHFLIDTHGRLGPQKISLRTSATISRLAREIITRCNFESDAGVVDDDCLIVVEGEIYNADELTTNKNPVSSLVKDIDDTVICVPARTTIVVFCVPGRNSPLLLEVGLDSTVAAVMAEIWAQSSASGKPEWFTLCVGRTAPLLRTETLVFSEPTDKPASSINWTIVPVPCWLLLSSLNGRPSRLYRNRYNGLTRISHLRLLLANDEDISSAAKIADPLLTEPVLLINRFTLKVWCSGSSPDETLGDAMKALGDNPFVTLVWELTHEDELREGLLPPSVLGYEGNEWECMD